MSRTGNCRRVLKAFTSVIYPSDRKAICCTAKHIRWGMTTFTLGQEFSIIDASTR